MTKSFTQMHTNFKWFTQHASPFRRFQSMSNVDETQTNLLKPNLWGPFWHVSFWSIRYYVTKYSKSNRLIVNLTASSLKQQTGKSSVWRNTIKIDSLRWKHIEKIAQRKICALCCSSTSLRDCSQIDKNNDVFASSHTHYNCLIHNCQMENDYVNVCTRTRRESKESTVQSSNIISHNGSRFCQWPNVWRLCLSNDRSPFRIFRVLSWQIV